MRSISLTRPVEAFLMAVMPLNAWYWCQIAGPPSWLDGCNVRNLTGSASFSPRVPILGRMQNHPSAYTAKRSATRLVLLLDDVVVSASAKNTPDAHRSRL